MSSTPLEVYPALTEIEGFVHGFVCRSPEVKVADAGKDEALRRLSAAHRDVIAGLGMPRPQLAEQIHGVGVEWVDGDSSSETVAPGMDGFATNDVEVPLGIYVADCCAVWVVDPVRKAQALVHSGKKGTEGKIVVRAIEMLVERAGSLPGDLVVQLSPCIRPPAYEVDFAAQIVRDAETAGVPAGQIHDCGICTASDPERYYSYRQEMGKTGRMIALGMWRRSFLLRSA